MKKLIFATNNAHKLAEVSPLLEGKYEIVTLAEAGIREDIPETADTLEGNASLKSHYIHARLKADCFADDTGLEVEALGGEPGVWSARYAGPQHDSEANVALLLQRMEGQGNRRARFRTVISLILDGKEHLFEGEVPGRITETRSGAKGFGYDPVFMPDGYDITFAEMELDEKNRISHRARAVQKLIAFLNDADANL